MSLRPAWATQCFVLPPKQNKIKTKTKKKQINPPKAKKRIVE
jgi:hypothetical protein